jgi:hypothetical protein
MDVPKARRATLLMLLGWIPLYFEGWVYNEGVCVVASVVSAYVVLNNLPFLSRYVHTKPIYFEDLLDDSAENDLEREKHQIAFLRMMNVCLSVVVGVVVEYGFLKMRHSKLTYVELFGVIGGLANLYRAAQNHIGKVGLFVLSRQKKQQHHHHQNTQIEVEMV